jgi:hypothetical protein
MANQGKRRIRPSIAAMLWAVASTSGCSVIFHADASQCSTNGDCTARGAAFANHICQAGTCVAQPVSDAGPDGSGPKDASFDGAGNAVADAAREAEAGFHCKSYADCHDVNNPMGDPQHQETYCDKPSGKCVQLTTDECPLVVGIYTDDAFAPIVFGAYAELPPNDIKSHPSYQNYEMAVNEFASTGILGTDPSSNTASKRRPVAVICNAAGDINTSMSHLVNDLSVTGIVAALDSATLATQFITLRSAGHDTFIINPFGSDSSILPPSLDVGAGNSSLLWHMLGQPGDVADAYAAFFPRFEAYARTKLSLTTEATRVATVLGDGAIVTTNLQAATAPKIKFNGLSINDNFTAGNYLALKLPSQLAGPGPSATDLDNAVNQLLQFKPHIIVSWAGPEFVTLLQRLEQPTLSPKPYWLVGPYNSVSQFLLGWVNQSTSGRLPRVAGIGVASTTDRSVLDDYQTRFVSTDMYPPASLGQENYYDAMYFMLYAYSAAGNVVSPSGAALGAAMARLVSGSAINTYNMGPGSMMSELQGLLKATSSNVLLDGTLGPPKFDLAKGARIGEGSVYCISIPDAGGVGYNYDVQRVVTTDAGTPGLSGIFPCYSGL